MKTIKRQSVRRRGAALVLAVVVSVLLAVVGVMFVMVARVGEMQTAAVIDNSDLDAAIQSVTARIQQTLIDDLFRGGDTIGNDSPHYNWPGVKKGGDPTADERINPWLASLEPDVAASQWVHITDLADDTVTLSRGVAATIIPDYQKKEDLAIDNAADADGDGVADSRWIQIPDTFTSRGKPVFAAIRIIDNCAMLNLNTAFGFYQQDSATPWHSKSWYAAKVHIPSDPYGVETAGDFGKKLGRILGEINFTPFMRAYDLRPTPHVERLRLAKDTSYSAAVPQEFHEKVILNIESPGNDFTLFGIDDELEIRNRYLLTSKTIARFEKRHLDSENREAISPYSGILYYTFDFGRGTVDYDPAGYGKSRVPSTPFTSTDFQQWKNKLDPTFFDYNPDSPTLQDYHYDRRHLSTFYSFDRPLRTGAYPLLEVEVPDEAERMLLMPDKARPIDLRTTDLVSDAKAIVHLLYALREVFAEGDPGKKSEAARQAAQMVVNIIDYLDADNDITVLDEPTITGHITALAGAATAAIFGFDPGEVFYGFERQPFISEIYSFNDGTGVLVFALELVNPYPEPINLRGWNIQVGSQQNVLDNTYSVPAASAGMPGRMVIHSGPITGFTAGASDKQRANFGLGTPMNNPDGILRLQRPDPLNAGEYLTVDAITETERLHLITTVISPAFKATCRDDTSWKFANRSAYTTRDSVQTLGQSNGVTSALVGYSLPVANSGKMERLTDFLKAALIGNQKGGVTPKTITEQIADAATEAEIRLNLETSPEVLDYVCFLNRPQGSLPGRININTAALHVIAAAIPPQLVMADVADTEHALYLADQIVANRPYQRVSDVLSIPAFQKFKNHATLDVGAQGIRNDYEERDWIVSRLANIFTVRSDTFTAYILVRLGADGPQRRMIAIFDRTNVWTPQDRPRLVALHPVPDPR